MPTGAGKSAIYQVAALLIEGPTVVVSPLIALQAEIVERLELRDPLLVVRGFDRPNLHLAVESFYEDDAKRDALLAAIDRAPKPGLVYAATRASTAELAAALAERGVAAAAYHA